MQEIKKIVRVQKRLPKDSDLETSACVCYDSIKYFSCHFQMYVIQSNIFSILFNKKKLTDCHLDVLVS